jgi:type IV pilus assembly protein PilA
MAVRRNKVEFGFTLIELMIAVAIIGILAGVALGQYREYALRARLSEAVLATGSCKTMVSEQYLSATTAPGAGGWGCESQAGTSSYVGAIQTSAIGAARVRVDNVDPLLNGQFVHLVPVKPDGTTAMSSSDLGQAVPNWLCGSDSQRLRSALPSNCRADTSKYASAGFE